MSRIVAICILLALSGFAHANPVMKIDVYSPNRKTFVSGGSATLINRHTGCLSTNQHVTAFSQAGAEFYINFQRVDVVWEHLEEDVAVVCFRSKPKWLPLAVQPGGTDAVLYKVYTARGYPVHTRCANEFECESATETPTFRSAPVRVTSVTAAIWSPAYALQAGIFPLQKLGVENPHVNLSSERLTLGTLENPDDDKRNFGGMSGGGLFDADNRLVGITTMSDRTGQIYSVPITVVPKVFFETSYNTK